MAPLAVNPNLGKLVDVPGDCLAYVYYVPGMMMPNSESAKKYEDLKNALNEYGKITEKNVFVGLWTQGAVDLNKVMSEFKIKESPAIVMFANPSIVAEEGKKMVFAKIDNQSLLNDLPTAVSAINTSCNLFMQGEVSKAIAEARKDTWSHAFNSYLEKVKAGISDFLKTHSVTFDLSAGSFKIIFAPAADKKDDSKGSKTSPPKKPT